MYIKFVRHRPFMSGNSRCKISGELLDDFRAPTQPALPLENLPPDVVVQQDQLSVDRERRFGTGRLNAGFQVGQECCIIRV